VANVLEFGAHLPLIDLGGPRPSLREYAQTADELGFRYVCANDHLVFRRPWLDGLTALASVAEGLSSLRLVTSVALPVVRGPVQLAKALATLDVLSNGHLVAGVGAGSSADDYAAAGIPFEQRWQRFDETLRVLRDMFAGASEPFEGEFYSTGGTVLELRPLQQPAPPIWIASWGAPAGLRRVARYGDGWLASAYNTTPERFRACLTLLRERHGVGDRFANALSTTWLCITDSKGQTERVYRDLLGPLLQRSPDELEALALPIGPAELCAERLSAFAVAGVERIFIWPLRDELTQLRRFRDQVVPLVRLSDGP
jgi:alkanesulfonate monooxygenase SsuD/methylene tetrahydromethanopterin reductase-like flavin-dependent oxidoreductase (luciferase family)